jgi:hypothetical protein
MKQHDRWLLARTLLLRKLDGRRSTSRLPELIEYVISRPLVSAGMIAKELGVTPRAAQNLVVELGLRNIFVLILPPRIKRNGPRQVPPLFLACPPRPWVVIDEKNGDAAEQQRRMRAAGEIGDSDLVVIVRSF